MITVEHGAFALLCGSIEELIDGSSEADHNAAGFEQFDITRVFDGAAAGSDNDAVTLRDFYDGVMFEPAEIFFAVELKDFRDGHIVIGFDFLIEIDEGATEFIGEHLTEGSFTGAHETDQNDIIFQGERSFLDRKIYSINCDINQGQTPTLLDCIGFIFYNPNITHEVNLTMRLEEIINENKPALNPTDLLICKYILNNRGQMRRISIHELAKRCCVSSTTVVRFAQKLGFDGFSDLKALLKHESAIDNVHSQDVLSALGDFYFKTWSNLMKLNYDGASRLVHEANRIFAFASGYVQSNVVQELKRMFFYDNVFIYDINGRDEFYSILATSNKDDLFIFVSLSGESHWVKEFSLQLQLKGVPLISITQMHENTLAGRSTENLYVFSEQFHVNDEEKLPFKSMLAYFLLLEIWYVNYRIYVKREAEST